MSDNYEDYAEATCPDCKRRSIEVRIERDHERPCPYCGRAFVGPPRCCIPDCGRVLPHASSLPVCRDCGVKIAMLHLSDAERYDAVTQARQRLLKPLADARRNGRLESSRVYYVQVAPDRIKIGFTSDLGSRLSALRVRRTAVLAVEPGGRDLETERHHQFRGDRISGRMEDFRPSQNLTAWIEDVRAQHGLPWPDLPDTSTVTVRSAD